MSSEIFRSFRKLPPLKCLKQPSSIFEIFGNCRKSLEIFRSLGKNRKMLESSQNDLPSLFENFQNFLEISGNVWICLENFGNPQKIFECNWRLMKFFYNIPILTPMD